MSFATFSRIIVSLGANSSPMLSKKRTSFLKSLDAFPKVAYFSEANHNSDIKNRVDGEQLYCKHRNGRTRFLTRHDVGGLLIAVRAL